MRNVTITVNDDVVEALSGRPGARYESPPQPEPQARLLARILLDVRALPSGDGPWHQPRAGGRRTVTLRPLDEPREQ